MKLLTIDIETRPNEVDAWGLWNQNIGVNQIQRPGGMICFAAKWHDKPSVMFYSDYHHGHEEMVQKAFDLLDEADALITYNGNKFDIPWLETEFVLGGLGLPAPAKSIDLLLTVKKKFRFPSNKLVYVTHALGLTNKLDPGGHTLWNDVRFGDEDTMRKAWNRMRRYNKRDVVITEQLHDRLLPHIKGYPHRGLVNGEIESCQNCGGTHLQRRGVEMLQTGSYPRYQCMDCGKWNRGTHRENHVTTRGTA